MTVFSASRILRASSSHNDAAIIAKVRALAKGKTNWSDTLALPKSTFPARPNSEGIERYRVKSADELYAWQRRKGGIEPDQSEARVARDDFVLHDGPPYANGALHVGHALNKVLKDLILRWELARGRKVHYRPGWDCHGLPIELKALQQPQSSQKEAKTLRDAPKEEGRAAKDAAIKLNATEIRGAARKLAAETVEVQKTSFREWGVMGDWDVPYTTMDKDFETRQLGVFREMVRKGLISRHHRPVYWSPSSRTALAEAELEYDEHHRCTAAFVKMPFVSLPKILEDNPAIDASNISALIWTTTPWTLPANKAIAVKDDIEYCVITVDDGTETATADQMLVAKDRVEHVLSYAPQGSKVQTIIESIPGSQLADGRAECYNLFAASKSPILQADFVTATSGTGLVHMAPGHGMEDYQVCQKNGISLAFAPVDDEGRYTADAFPANPAFQGLHVQTMGVRAVLEILKEPEEYLPRSAAQRYSLVFASHSFVHKNPIDWRTKEPVITRATAQWFADTSAIKARALEALDGVLFIPETGKARLRSFVEGRSQWCISRQRAWGVPIPALYHVTTGEACITDESIGHIISVIDQRGIDAWFSDDSHEPSWLHSSLEPGKWVRGKDTMDVWFDSGTSWTCLDPRGSEDHRSDIYLEGTDQHRGWFQSSLLTTIATQDPNRKPVAPFKTLITHGFTLDKDGRKMSKSLGNVVSPEEIISGALVQAPRGKNKKGQQKQAPPTKAQKTSLGPDVLRLWAASSDYTRDVSISQPVLQSVQQALQKYRVTFKFLLGVLHDYPEDTPVMPPSPQLSFADQVVLHQLGKTSKAVFDAFAGYKFFAGVAEINKFINLDLSAFYFEIIKDKLYTGSVIERRHMQAVLLHILCELIKMLNPVTPHLIEEVWEYAPEAIRGNVPWLRQVWDAPFDSKTLVDVEAQDLDTKLEVFKKISTAVKITQEDARTARALGSGLACRVEIYLTPQCTPAYIIRWLQKLDLAELLVVSEAEVVFQQEPDQEDVHEEAWRYTTKMRWATAAPPSNDKWTERVVVLPPKANKCVRCWKFTAEEEGLPCGRCRDVLIEKME